MRTPKNDDQPRDLNPVCAPVQPGAGLGSPLTLFSFSPTVSLLPSSLCSQVDLTADSVVVASAITIKNDKGGSNLVDFVWPSELVKAKS